MGISYSPQSDILPAGFLGNIVDFGNKVADNRDMTTPTFKQANATKISQTLREAGIPKASAYKTFGRDVDGFLVMKSNISKNVSVATTLSHDQARIQCDRIVAVLTEAGYEVVTRKNNGIGGTYSLDVKAQ